MRPTVTKFSKLEPGEENTHESCANTRQSSHKNSTWSTPSWINSIWKKHLYWGLLLACERPTGQQSISSIPHSKGFVERVFEVCWIQLHFEGGYFRHLRAFCSLKLTTAFTPLESAFNFRSSDTTYCCVQRVSLCHERINTSTVFVQVLDRVISTGQTANTSRRKSTGDFSRYIACKHKNNHKNAKKTFFLFI